MTKTGYVEYEIQYRLILVKHRLAGSVKRRLISVSFFMRITVNGASWTLHSTYDAQRIGHFHCDSKRQQTCVEQIFMLMLKNYFASLITGSRSI